jgi:uncharacterized glyoxalase superfamily protein PhnB
MAHYPDMKLMYWRRVMSTNSNNESKKMIENITPILYVRNIQESITYYTDALGFNEDWTTNGFTGLSRDGWRIYLSEGGHGQPGMWLWIGVMDLDRLYQELQSKGAKIESEIESYEWAREFRVADLDGHILRFGGEPE